MGYRILLGHGFMSQPSQYMGRLCVINAYTWDHKIQTWHRKLGAGAGAIPFTRICHLRTEVPLEFGAGTGSVLVTLVYITQQVEGWTRTVILSRLEEQTHKERLQHIPLLLAEHPYVPNTEGMLLSSMGGALCCMCLLGIQYVHWLRIWM